MIDIRYIKSNNLDEYMMSGYKNASLQTKDIFFRELNLSQTSIFDLFYKNQPDILLVSDKDITDYMLRCFKKYADTIVMAVISKEVHSYDTNWAKHTISFNEDVVADLILPPAIDSTYVLPETDRKYTVAFSEYSLDNLSFLKEYKKIKIFSQDDWPLSNYVGYPHPDSLPRVLAESEHIIDTGKQPTHVMANAIAHNIKLTIPNMSKLYYIDSDQTYASRLAKIAEVID